MEGLLFLAGAVVGFGLTAGLELHSRQSKIFAPREHGSVRLWGGFHLVSVGLAIAGTALVTSLIKSPIVWLAVGFVGTFVYLVVIAAQFTFADVHDR